MEREAERKERFDQVQNDPMKWVKAAVPGYAHALPIHWDTQASRMDTSLSEDNGRRLGIVADQTRSLRR